MKYLTNNRSLDDTNFLPSKSKHFPSDHFRVCPNFTEIWNFISTWKIGFNVFGIFFKASQRKDSYGTILADLCRTVRSTVVQNLEIFSDRVAVHFLRSNNSEFGALFEFIRNAIGSESAVSQTPPKQ